MPSPEDNWPQLHPSINNPESPLRYYSGRLRHSPEPQRSNIINSSKKKSSEKKYLTNLLFEYTTMGQFEEGFVEFGDNNLFDSNYRIEPITIPLLLSLSEQLSKYYKEPIELLLYNNNATKDVLNFL